MILPRAGSALLALLFAAATGATVGATVASAGEGVPVLRVSERCDMYGVGFVDLGNGTCGRLVINGRMHVDAGARAAAANSWTAGSTSTAGLRSDGTGMLPGAAAIQHLRIPGEPYGR